MQIEILSVTVNTVPTAKGSYQVAEVAYKDEGGKVNDKKIMSFTNKGVFETVSKAQTGNIFDVETSKDDKGYWQWNHIKPASRNASAPAQSIPTPRSNYETPEERKQRQDYIIRQSSLSTAVAVLKTEKNIPSVEDVTYTAEQFVKFVYNKADSITSIEQMEDDIPY